MNNCQRSFVQSLPAVLLRSSLCSELRRDAEIYSCVPQVNFAGMIGLDNKIHLKNARESRSDS